uniref:DDE-1 domain-containing protein n=1 Tax=Lagenidium giganteum TaxID=4803 RepID=A0AAV2YRD5_9STRA
MMGQQRHAIDIFKKQEAITWIEKHGEGVHSRAAVHFHKLGWTVDAATFRKLWRDRDAIMRASPYRKRLKGCGRKPVLGELEDILLDAITNRRLDKEKVTRDWIALAAVSKFMKRNDLSLRRRTNLTVLSDDKLVQRAVSYMTYLQEHRSEWQPENTILMDETAKTRVTLPLTSPLTPLVISRKKQGGRSISSVGGGWVCHQPKAWVDSELLLKWLVKIFPPVVVAEGKALVWDSMRAHVSKKVKSKCSQRDIAMCVVPGGLTPYVEAGDLAIYKVFKDHLSVFIDEWKRSDEVEYTRNGNPRPPQVETVCAWVRQAWRETPESVVVNSVDAAGFCDDPSRWFIWNHDVYGWKFRQAWATPQAELTDTDAFNMGGLDYALDDVDVVEE